MIEIVIPKDIRKYEAKLIGPFTARQCVCFAAAVGLCLLAYGPVASLFGTDTAIAACMVLASPFVICGWVKIYGMFPEVFLKSTFIGMFLAPKNRLYKVNNLYTKEMKLQKMNENEYSKRMKREKKLAKENPDYQMIK